MLAADLASLEGFLCCFELVELGLGCQAGAVHRWPQGHRVSLSLGVDHSWRGNLVLTCAQGADEASPDCRQNANRPWGQLPPDTQDAKRAGRSYRDLRGPLPQGRMTSSTADHVASQGSAPQPLGELVQSVGMDARIRREMQRQQSALDNLSRRTLGHVAFSLMLRKTNSRTGIDCRSSWPAGSAGAMVGPMDPPSRASTMDSRLATR